MSTYGSTKPSQFRLPRWVADYVEERSKASGVTKTDVIVEAVSCLRERETQELMRQGYEEMSEQNLRAAEEGLGGSADCLPEW